MDRSFCPSGREHAKRRGAVQDRPYGDVAWRRIVGRRQLHRPPSAGLSSLQRSCYFSVKRTEVTDLPAFETATTTLVPGGALKLPLAFHGRAYIAVACRRWRRVRTRPPWLRRQHHRASV